MKTAAKPQEHPPLTIMYPRFSCPAILQPNESFDIEIDIQEYDQAYIYLETAHEPVTDSYWLSIDAQQQNVYTIFSVTLPETIPVELYNLTIFIEDAGNIYAHTQPHAISIVDEITNSYSFIQVSDLHLGDIRGISVSFFEYLGWKSI